MKALVRQADRYLYGLLLALVLIMPFHAFLVISLGHLTGHQALWQTWKETVTAIGGIAALIRLFTSQPLRIEVRRRAAHWAAVVFIAIALLVSLVHHENGLYTVVLGAKTSLEFVLLFLVLQTAEFSQRRWAPLIKVLLAASSVIGVFTILQVYFLPVDFLARFGYGPTTVLPYHLVDPAVTAIRIIGTFAGPNQLASFMVIPFIISAWIVLRRRLIATVPLLLSGFALYHSYSRSAWIGALVGLIVMVGLYLKGWWRLAVVAVIGLLIVVGVSINSASKNPLNNLRFYIFHGQIIDGHAQGSDQARLNNAQHGLDLIRQQPLGYGLGTAGPASQSTAHPIITENSYLQIGIETGVAGLIAFGLLLAFITSGLYARRDIVDEARPLIAILIGLSVTNLFLHTWSDSATSLVLWGLVGYASAAIPTRGRS